MPPRTVKRSKSPAAKSLTKTQLAAELADKVGVTKAIAAEFLDTLHAIAAKELKGGRPLTLPNLVKLSLTRKAATPARPGRNPFTGEAITIKAKPARNVVKVRAVKALKDVA